MRAAHSALLPVGATELVSAAAVAEGLDRMAAEIQGVVNDQECVLLGVLSGGLFTLVRLADRLQGNYRIDYCHASRYGDQHHGAGFHLQRKPALALHGLTVIVVDDIYDRGITMAGVCDYCQHQGAAQVLSAALVVKNTPAHLQGTPPDFSTGLTVPDVFVFGCGMDLDGRWRHLPAIYRLHEN